MSLREHVCGEDVDAAISILVTSFINAQKFSVRSSLERGFHKFLTCTSDFFDLLLYALRSLLREAQTYATLRAHQRGVHGMNLELKVRVDDFELKVREYAVRAAGDALVVPVAVAVVWLLHLFEEILALQRIGALGR